MKLYLPFAALCGICCLILNGFFLSAMQKQLWRRAVWLKAAASVCFVLIALLAVLKKPENGYFLIAFLCGFAGDILLGLRYVYEKQKTLLFAIGALSFAAEHLLFILRFLHSPDTSLLFALIYLAVTLAGAAVYTGIHKTNAGKLQPFGVLYIALVCFMSGLALSAAVRAPSVSSVLFACGGILFAGSDVILSEYNFGNDRRFLLSRLLHWLYFGAQLLIAGSLLF